MENISEEKDRRNEENSFDERHLQKYRSRAELRMRVRKKRVSVTSGQTLADRIKVVRQEQEMAKEKADPSSISPQTYLTQLVSDYKQALEIETQLGESFLDSIARAKNFNRRVQRMIGAGEDKDHAENKSVASRTRTASSVTSLPASSEVSLPVSITKSMDSLSSNSHNMAVHSTISENPTVNVENAKLENNKEVSCCNIATTDIENKASMELSIVLDEKSDKNLSNAECCSGMNKVDMENKTEPEYINKNNKMSQEAASSCERSLSRVTNSNKYDIDDDIHKTLPHKTEDTECKDTDGNKGDEMPEEAVMIVNGTPSKIPNPMMTNSKAGGSDDDIINSSSHKSVDTPMKEDLDCGEADSSSDLPVLNTNIKQIENSSESAGECSQNSPLKSPTDAVNDSSMAVRQNSLPPQEAVEVTKDQSRIESLSPDEIVKRSPVSTSHDPTNRSSVLSGSLVDSDRVSGKHSSENILSSATASLIENIPECDQITCCKPLTTSKFVIDVNDTVGNDSQDMSNSPKCDGGDPSESVEINKPSSLEAKLEDTAQLNDITNSDSILTNSKEPVVEKSSPSIKGILISGLLCSPEIAAGHDEIPDGQAYQRTSVKSHSTETWNNVISSNPGGETGSDISTSLEHSKPSEPGEELFGHVSSPGGEPKLDKSESLENTKPSEPGEKLFGLVKPSEPGETLFGLVTPPGGETKLDKSTSLENSKPSEPGKEVFGHVSPPGGETEVDKSTSVENSKLSEPGEELFGHISPPGGETKLDKSESLENTEPGEESSRHVSPEMPAKGFNSNLNHDGTPENIHISTGDAIYVTSQNNISVNRSQDDFSTSLYIVGELRSKAQVPNASEWQDNPNNKTPEKGKRQCDGTLVIEESLQRDSDVQYNHTHESSPDIATRLNTNAFNYQDQHKPDELKTQEIATNLDSSMFGERIQHISEKGSIKCATPSIEYGGRDRTLNDRIPQGNEEGETISVNGTSQRMGREFGTDSSGDRIERSSEEVKSTSVNSATPVIGSELDSSDLGDRILQSHEKVKFSPVENTPLEIGRVLNSSTSGNITEQNSEEEVNAILVKGVSPELQLQICSIPVHSASSNGELRTETGLDSCDIPSRTCDQSELHDKSVDIASNGELRTETGLDSCDIPSRTCDQSELRDKSVDIASSKNNAVFHSDKLTSPGSDALSSESDCSTSTPQLLTGASSGEVTPHSYSRNSVTSGGSRKEPINYEVKTSEDIESQVTASGIYPNFNHQEQQRSEYLSHMEKEFRGNTNMDHCEEQRKSEITENMTMVSRNDPNTTDYERQKKFVRKVRKVESILPTGTSREEIFELVDTANENTYSAFQDLSDVINYPVRKRRRDRHKYSLTRKQSNVSTIPECVSDDLKGEEPQSVDDADSTVGIVDNYVSRVNENENEDDLISSSADINQSENNQHMVDKVLDQPVEDFKTFSYDRTYQFVALSRDRAFTDPEILTQSRRHYKNDAHRHSVQSDTELKSSLNPNKITCDKPDANTLTLNNAHLLAEGLRNREYTTATKNEGDKEELRNGRNRPTSKRLNLGNLPNIPRVNRVVPQKPQKFETLKLPPIPKQVSSQYLRSKTCFKRRLPIGEAVEKYSQIRRLYEQLNTYRYHTPGESRIHADVTERCDNSYDVTIKWGAGNSADMALVRTYYPIEERENYVRETHGGLNRGGAKPKIEFIYLDGLPDDAFFTPFRDNELSRFLTPGVKHTRKKSGYRVNRTQQRKSVFNANHRRNVPW